jgi:CheY-like chemotaxis protein
MKGKTVLLVEDDVNDVFFMKRAFQEAGILNPVQIVYDGRQAMNYLSGDGEYADREKFPFPCLVLLDLNLPWVMGLNILKWVREQSRTKTLIVIILSSSQLGPDIEQAYQLGANAYLVKPSTPPELRELVTGIKHFWLKLNHGPAGSQEAAGHAAAHGVNTPWHPTGISR